MGRFMYKSNMPASCITFNNLFGYYHDVVIVANQMDDGEEINQILMTIGERITSSQLTINNLLLFLPSPNTVLRPPEYRLNYCVLRVKGDGVEFKEVFTFGPTSTIPAEEVVGWWSPDNAKKTFIPYRGDVAAPHDFQGNVVRIVAIENMPYITVKRTLDGKVETDGYLSELCKLIGEELNFTIEWIETPDGEFGVPGDDGSFTGTVGMLQRKEADISAVALNIDIDRAEVVDFSPPIEYAFSKLLIYREQGKEDIDWKTYVTGFHWGVWLSVLGTWFLMSVGLVFVAKREVEVTVYNYLFTFIGTLAQQGSSYEPQCTRGRIVFLSFWLASVLIYASYTASLTSQLAVINTVDPFTNLKEALTTAGYSVAIQKGTSYLTNVKSMANSDESMRLFYHQLLTKPHLKVSNNREGMKLIQQGKYAFFQDTVSVNYDIKSSCSYSWLGPGYFPEFASMGYAKNLSYANVISQILARATDSGIARKLMKKWMGEKAPCESSPFQNLGFSKTVSAFSLLVLGLVLGTVLLLVEMWVHSGRLFQPSRKRHSRRGFKVDKIKIQPYDFTSRHRIS
ncbi:probable glutamate receptor [Palaemon carinicauda]|uniref:probable glutamate receptor n=1 Tax=Palaemon carinicauda TaxID=392227 RepID=UPI0035B639E3